MKITYKKLIVVYLKQSLQEATWIKDLKSQIPLLLVVKGRGKICNSKTRKCKVIR